jgi:hypothetical protein
LVEDRDHKARFVVNVPLPKPRRKVLAVLDGFSIKLKPQFKSSMDLIASFYIEVECL